MVDVEYIFDELLRLGEKEFIMQDLRYINLPLLRQDLESLLNNGIDDGIGISGLSLSIGDMFYRYGQKSHHNFIEQIYDQIDEILSTGGYPRDDDHDD